jgi:hypothetical protein
VLITDLCDHPHRALTQLWRIPPTYHDPILPNKWSLRTCRGGSDTGFENL